MPEGDSRCLTSSTPARITLTCGQDRPGSVQVMPRRTDPLLPMTKAGGFSGAIRQTRAFPMRLIAVSACASGIHEVDFTPALASRCGSAPTSASSGGPDDQQRARRASPAVCHCHRQPEAAERVKPPAKSPTEPERVTKTHDSPSLVFTVPGGFGGICGKAGVVTSADRRPDNSSTTDEGDNDLP